MYHIGKLDCVRTFFFLIFGVSVSKNKLASTSSISFNMHNKPTNLKKAEMCFEGDLISNRTKQSLSFDNKLGNKRNPSH